MDKVASLMEKQEWDGLEDYIVAFLKSQSDGENAEEHPGLLFSLYEAKIATMISDEAGDALGFFKAKVGPLLRYKDSIFCPVDLSICIEKLKKCIQKRYIQPLCNFLFLPFILFEVIHFSSLQVPTPCKAWLISIC